MTRRSRQAGLSLIETAITLSVMMTLTAVMAPAAMTLVEQARELHVQRDCASLRDAVIKLLVDTNQTSLRLLRGRGPAVDMLVSAGAAPGIDPSGDPRWGRTPDAAGIIDLADHYLVDNAPAGNPLNAWSRPREMAGPGWRGAYVPVVPPNDPWGHRYAINVKYLGTRNDVLVVSAGPNGTMDTPFQGSGLLPGGDDRAVLVR